MNSADGLAMKVCVLFNPRSGSAPSMAGLREKLSANPDLTIRELGPDGDLALSAADAARQGFDLIAVAGGDGSVNAAATGLIQSKSEAALAVLPLGTGNDFCRTMAIPIDPLAAAELLRGGTARAVDVARVGGGGPGYMVNAATGGFSGLVASEVTAEMKHSWGPLAYLRGALAPIADPPRYRVTLRLDGGPPESFDLLNLVIANCRTAAGGVLVAPNANPEDGRLDIVLVRTGDRLDLSVIAARLMHGDYQRDENVIHRLAARVEIESDPPLPVSIDGELCEGPRFTFEVVPKSLRVLAGPDYSAMAPHDRPIEEEDEDSQPLPLPPPEAPRGVAARTFGLIAGLLLLAKRTPPAYAIGFGLIATGVLVFAWLARGASGGRWKQANAAVQASIRAPASPALDRFALTLTWLGGVGGTTAAVIALMAVFLGRRHYLTAATLLVVLAGVLMIEAVLKPIFALARPPSLGDGYPREWSFAFPSGHALRAVGIYGYVAVLAAIRGWRHRQPGWLAVTAVCLGLALGVCWSRVYLGVHWPMDVLAGAIAASAWVTACLIARHYAMTRRGSANPGGSI